MKSLWNFMHSLQLSNVSYNMFPIISFSVYIYIFYQRYAALHWILSMKNLIFKLLKDSESLKDIAHYFWRIHVPLEYRFDQSEIRGGFDVASFL